MAQVHFDSELLILTSVSTGTSLDPDVYQPNGGAFAQRAVVQVITSGEEADAKVWYKFGSVPIADNSFFLSASEPGKLLEIEGYENIKQVQFSTLTSSTEIKLYVSYSS